MQSATSLPALQRFLVAAKQATYAMLGDDASVESLLPDCRQLEYRDGDYFYRDIYAGMLQFVGQEIVYCSGRAIWSMSYAGGLCADVDTPSAGQVYAFLRQALLHTPHALPLRGPQLMTHEAMHYTCQNTGSIERFHGAETITIGTQCLHQLHFAGGMLA
jgi:hypothetical protein